MFGLLRFLLAYLVVVSHLVGSEYVAHFGFYAVIGFFIIAGYIITSALNEVYHFDGVRFWTNRALRLLPPYYLVCVITLAVVAAVPDQAGQYPESTLNRRVAVRLAAFARRAALPVPARQLLRRRRKGNGGQEPDE